MPYVVTGEPGNHAEMSVGATRKYDYDYPSGLNLAPDSKLHKKIISRLIPKAQASFSEMSTRFASWNLIDESMTAYMSADDDEKDLVSKDSRKPISIVFPYSYAMEETLLAYLMAAFVQDPIFRYDGVGPEDTVGSMLLELVIQNHCIRSKVGLNLHTQFRDSLRYGLGISSPGWQTVNGKRKRMVPGEILDVDGNLTQGPPVPEVEDFLAFEGNTLHNVDPYRYLPDPNVASHEVQLGEFNGWSDKTNYLNLLEKEQSDPNMFNVRYLNHYQNRRSQFTPDNSGRTRKTHGSSRIIPNTADSNQVDTITMYVNLIPNDWDLGPKDTPEKWCFVVAADAVVLKAYPLDYYHNKYPITAISPDFDGYTATPVSRMEVLWGLQNTLDWLFNSHIANVRKAVNDMIIVDPQMVNINDMKSDKPGKLIRLRRPAWGRGVKDVAMQLQVNDITRGNIADSGWIVQWMQRIAAADDTQMGSLRQGGPERLTGAEFRGTQAGKVSRLQRMAQVIGLQGMQDIGMFFASHTQQFMSQETFVKITGRWREDLADQFQLDPSHRASVSPNDIAIGTDVLVRDGSVPGGNFSEAWLQLFNTIMTNQEMSQEFDVVRIFTHIAKNLGAKNVEDFKRKSKNVNTQVQSDDQVAKQVKAGNLRPVG